MREGLNKLKGVILGYRRSKATQYNDQVLIKVFVEPRNLSSIIGARVFAKDGHGNEYRGRVLKVHSRRNSVVIARFKPNIPGQLIGQHVEIVKELKERSSA